MNNPFQLRREKLFTQLKDNSLTILFSGEPLRKSADSEYEFEANRNFYYLTGINEPSAILVLAKTKQGNREILFIRDINYDLEKWIGIFISPKEAIEVSGINNIQFVSGFENYFSRSLIHMEIESVGLDGDRQNFNSQPLSSEHFAKKLTDKHPLLNLFDVYPFIAKMRLIKDEHEIKAIKEAVALTNKAIEAVLLEMKPGMYEYEMEARFLYEVHRHHGTEMFDTIMASGKNGVILHYVENKAKTQDGDLVLFDLGAKLNHYGADISRTFPVNGVFSERQKQIYNIVLDAMDVVTNAVKPGVTLLELNDLVKEFFVEKLTKINLIQDPFELAKYYYHSVGHHLGLDTHDIGNTENTVLEAGMVITNEPGLYIKEENIGIRIETDLLVTNDGCIDLAPQIIKTVEEIESFMKK